MICPSLHFPGNAEEALAHYQAALGGEIAMTRFTAMPSPEHIPPGWDQKVLHSALRTPHGEIHVMDAPPGMERPSGGNMSVVVQVDDDARAAEIFKKLAEDGTVFMPFEQTFFARKFGMTADRFGVTWMVSVAPVEPGAAPTNR